jgi:phage terminase large subunit-like protein
MAKDSTYNKDAADFAVSFIECLCHTKGTWAGKPFDLIDWQEKIIRDIFGILNLMGIVNSILLTSKFQKARQIRTGGGRCPPTLLC